jgi:hypothetical protein
MRETRDETGECGFGRAVRSPAMIGHCAVAGGTEDDDFAVPGVQGVGDA